MTDDEWWYTTCYRCGRMNIPVENDAAADFCAECCICGNCTVDGIDHESCLEEGSVEWRDIEA